MKPSLLLFLLMFVFFFLSCNFQKIETEKGLDKKTLHLIESVGLLDKDEHIIKYYSNFEKGKAGNFFTNKRVAHYWLDVRNKEKSDTTFALYKNIAYIDTVYEVPNTFCPYMEIKSKDSSTFKVYVDGSRSEIKSFFEDAIKIWNIEKGKTNNQ